MTECKSYCNLTKARHVARATWVCPDCGRDISMEYLLWYEAAHPELLEDTHNSHQDCRSDDKMPE